MEYGFSQDEKSSLRQEDNEIVCPQCGSPKVWKDGLRYTNNQEVQRYLCRVCGYRFSKFNIELNIIRQDRKLLNPSSNLTKEMVSDRNLIVEEGLDSFPFLVSKNVSSQDSKPSSITTVGKDLNAFLSNSALCQVSVNKPKLMKNLAKVENQPTIVAGATVPTNEVKGKILEYAF